MITEILSKNCMIMESNTLYLFEPYSDLTMHFESGSDEFNFNVKLMFKTDKDLEQSAERMVTENEVAFRFTNFDNPLGSGTSNPLEIATINDRKLYMHIWVYAVGQNQNAISVRKIEYTVFMER